MTAENRDQTIGGLIMENKNHQKKTQEKQNQYQNEKQDKKDCK